MQNHGFRYLINEYNVTRPPGTKKKHFFFLNCMISREKSISQDFLVKPFDEVSEKRYC